MQAQKAEGTRDLIGREMRAWQKMQQVAGEVFGPYGFSAIETPALEQLDVFVHGIGQSTDVVRKEMFRVFSGANFARVLEEGTDAKLKPKQRLALLYLPEADFAAVQTRYALFVFDHIVFFAVERKFAVCDSVAVSAHERTEIGAFCFVVGNVVETENYVVEFSVAVGDAQAADNRAVVENLHGCSARVFKDVFLYGSSVRRFAEFRNFDVLRASRAESRGSQ